MIGFYLRKLFTIFKGEVLVLPSRVVVLLFFFVLLLLPVVTQDPYLLRILILTSIFAIFAASWDLLSGFTGQMNFGHALFFGVAAYTAALIESARSPTSLGEHPPGGPGRGPGRSDYRHPLPQAQGDLPGPDHLGLPDYPDGHCLRNPPDHGGRVGNLRTGSSFRVPPHVITISRW